MYTIEETYSYEFTVKKSRFCAYLIPADNVKAVETALALLKEEHPGATHHCFAYIIPPNTIRFSDDGEPARTAGLPIYEQLLQFEATAVLCVVVRYFGGIKLGAGGLVRAYRKAAAEVLRLAHWTPLVETVTIRFTFAYSAQSAVEAVLADYPATNRTYGELVSITYRLPEPDVLTLIRGVKNATGGKVKIEKLPASLLT